MFKQLRARVVIVSTVLGLLLASALVAISADSQVRPVTGLAVFDGRGKLVGSVIDVVDPTNVTVAIEVGSALVTLTVFRDHFGPSARVIGTQLLYESADCTGQGFDAHNPDDVFPPNEADLFSTLFMNGQTLYETSGPARPITVASSRSEEDGTTCEQVQFSGTFLPMRQVADLALEFQAPFSLGDRN